MYIMKTLKYKSFAFFFFVLLGFSCSDEFLETNPLALESEVSFYTNMQAADMATTVCYSIFSIEKMWDLTVIMAIGSIASDEAEAGAGGKSDIPEYQSVDQLRHTANSPNIFNRTYGYIYRSIGYCNVALEKLNPDDPDNPIKKDPNYDEALIRKHVAEAYFLRAFNYFTITQIHGGVPLVDHVLTPSEFTLPRSSIKEIYDLIKSDLNKAIAVLPEKSEWGIQNAGRASKGAAKALLAKVYLYESSYAKNYPGDERFAGLTQKWDSVNYWAEQVINSGEYELVGSNGERFPSWRSVNGVGGFSHIFSPGANNSAEEVFSIQCKMDGLGWFWSRGTSLIQWCAPRRKSDGPVATGNGDDYGWGWWCPSDFLAGKFDPLDMRLKATVMSEGDSILTATGWGVPNFNEFPGNGIVHYQRKYECSPAEYWAIKTSWKEGPTNVKLIRIADVHLWNAEAYMERSMNTEALLNINKVRARARASGYSGVPADLTGTLTHSQIEDERLFELGCEGHRFFDLVRWKLANQYLDHYLADGDRIDFEEGKHEFFPIPATEINLSNGNLIQNNGY